MSSATLSQTFTALPEQEFDQAVGLICDPAKRIACFGGRFSQLLAEYLDLHLRLLRPGTLLHTAAPGRDAGFRLDLSRRDVCVVFDFRRYQDDTVRLARHAHERGAKVVLFTDPWLSPVAEFADAVLPARVEAPSPFDSIAAPWHSSTPWLPRCMRAWERRPTSGCGPRRRSGAERPEPEPEPEPDPPEKFISTHLLTLHL